MSREDFLSLYHRVKNSESYSKFRSYREDNQFLFAHVEGGASIYKTSFNDAFRNGGNELEYVDKLHNDVDDITSYEDFIMSLGNGVYELCHRKYFFYTFDFYNNEVECEEGDSYSSDFFIVLNNNIELIV